MKKKIRLLLCCFFLMATVLSPSAVYAGYYENHKDWDEYCMQARDVKIGQMELEEIVRNNNLSATLIERSELFVNEFQKENATEYWKEYAGNYQVDYEELEPLITSETLGTAQVTFYMDGSDKSQNYLSIQVEVVADNEVASQMPESQGPVQEGTDTSGLGESLETFAKPQGVQNNSHSDQEKGIVKLLLSTCVLSFGGYGCAIYSDLKVLRKYRKKVYGGVK